MPNPFDSARFLARLGNIVGPRHLLTDPEELAPFLTDWRGRYSGGALALARPGSTEETAALVRHCQLAGVPVVPQGGNTGLVGGATPDARGHALIIQTRRLNHLRAIDPINNTMIAEAGVTLAQARKFAQKAGRLFPLSLASEGSCQIGGNISTNAGGVQVLRYGAMRDLTLGLEAVLPDGEIWRGLNCLRKNNTGYDLKQLLIGAEGTLGIVTAAVLKLFPLPRHHLACWLGLPSPTAALTLLSWMQGIFDARLTAFELICPRAFYLVQKHFPRLTPLPPAPWHVLCELSDCADDEESRLRTETEKFLAGHLANGILQEAVLSRTEAERARFWQWRENISEAQKREGISIKHDIALPLSRVPEFLERIVPRLEKNFPGICHTAFGHLGDGNLHFNLSMPEPEANARLIKREAEANRLVYDLVHELSGSISAEHGIGQLKRALLPRYKTPTEITAMRAIKRALDPAGLMNPGKVLPDTDVLTT
jgi:FAD/FMN-containing dehydrogenase